MSAVPYREKLDRVAAIQARAFPDSGPEIFFVIVTEAQSNRAR